LSRLNSLSEFHFLPPLKAEEWNAFDSLLTLLWTDWKEWTRKAKIPHRQPDINCT